jgi:hypothetical protein
VTAHELAAIAKRHCTAKNLVGNADWLASRDPNCRGKPSGSST